ncbi:MAG: hypothetical protein QXV69_07390 [Sulfolobaceae archaeon]
MLPKVKFIFVLLLLSILPILSSQVSSFSVIGYVSGLMPISLHPINSTYLIFYSNISAYYVINVSTYSGITFQQAVAKSNLVASFNNNLYKFNLTALSIPSVSNYGGKLLITFIGTIQNIINLTLPSSIKNISLYYMFFDGKSFTNPAPLISSGVPESVLTNGTHIIVLWKSGYNSNKSYLLIYRDFKLIRNVSLAVNVTSLVMFYKNRILAINSPLLNIFQSITRIQLMTTNFLTAYIMDFNGSTIREFNVNFVGSIYGSPELFFVSSYNGLSSTITIYNLTLGKAIQQFTLPYFITSFYYYYNKYIVYSGIKSELTQIRQVIQTEVYKGGSWYNYSYLTFPLSTSSSIQNTVTLSGVFFSNVSTILFLTNMTNIILSRGPPIQVQGIIQPWNLIINFTPPPKPEVNIRQVNSPGQTTIYISYNEINANLYGVYNITVYVNNKPIYSSNKPSGTVNYNVYENGTYNIVVTATNVFGTTNTTKQVQAIVLPSTTIGAQTSSTTTMVTTTKTEITTTVSSIQQPLSTTTLVQTTTSTQQQGGGIPLLTIIVVVVIIIAIVAFLLIRRQ